MGIVNSVSIPSSSSGELYTVTEYDDGGFMCSCPYGSRKGVVGLGVKPCKHVRTYQSQQAHGIMPEVLPAAFSESDLGFDASEVFAYLSSSFAPVGFLCDLTREVLKVDAEARRKTQETIAQGKTPSSSQRKPLPDESRSVLESFLDKMEYAYTVRDSNRNRAEGTELAVKYLTQALGERVKETASASNHSIAVRLHRELARREM